MIVSAFRSLLSRRFFLHVLAGQASFRILRPLGWGCDAMLQD